MTDQLQTMPVKIMRVEDWEKIAYRLPLDDETISSKIVALQSSYESLIHQPLKKGDFVPPKKLLYPSQAEFDGTIDEYEDDLADLVFEGFELHPNGGMGEEIWLKDSIHHLYYKSGDKTFIAHLGHSGERRVDTLFDFIYYVDKYRRTNDNPINLTFTKAFLKKVING